MKKTVGKIFKRIVSMMLVVALTLGTVYMSYTKENDNCNVDEMERIIEPYVVQCEESDSEGDKPKTDEDTATDAYDYLEKSEISNNINSATIDLPEVSVDENINSEAELSNLFDDVKTNEICGLSVGISDETENNILQWEERKSISSVDIYARYDETGFKRIANVTDAEYEVDTAADYRIVANTVDGEKIGSNVVTLVKSEKSFSA